MVIRMNYRSYRVVYQRVEMKVSKDFVLGVERRLRAMCSTKWFKFVVLVSTFASFFKLRTHASP